LFFSFASDKFLQTDNLVSILQSTAVNGVLAIACTLRHHHRRHRPVGGLR
jgi:ribose/xylose/arabinose/galactoside ABC-type transport system permease subunit